MNIYDVNGNIITQPLITKTAEHEEELMKSDFVRLAWDDAEYIEIPVDSYIIPYDDGIRYSLMEPYQPEQKNEAHWHYEPLFQHPKMYLGKVPFVRPTKDSEQNDITLLDWPYTGTVGTLLGYFCQQIDDALGLSGDNAFEVVIIGEVPEIVSATFSTQDILSALSNVANICNCEWHIEWTSTHKTLFFGRIMYLRDEIEPMKLTVGDNIGMPSIRSSKDGFYNVFEPQGSTRNITRRAASGEYVQANVRLDLRSYEENGVIKYPDGRIYTDGKGNVIQRPAFDTLGAKPYIKSLIFEDVFPRLDLYVYGVKYRERYLLEDENNPDSKVIDHYEGSTPVYKKYAVWYVKLALPTAFDGETPTAWRDYAVTEKQIIDGKSLYGQWKVNKTPGAETSPLAGRGDGDNGNYGFGMIFLGLKDDSYIMQANLPPTEDGDTGIRDAITDATSTIDNTYYEIVLQKKDDYILPTTKTQGIIPKGKATASQLGNIVNLYNLVMSSEYTQTAQQELEAETEKYIEKSAEDDNSYSFKSNPIAFEKMFREDEAQNRDSHLYIGQKVHYIDGQTYADENPLETRVMKIITKLDYGFEQEITIGNEILKGTTQTLKEQVDTLILGSNASGTGSGSISESSITRVLENWVTPRFLSKVNDDTASGIITFLRGLISEGEAIFKGLLTAFSAKINEIRSHNFTGWGVADTGFELTNNYDGTGASGLVVDYIYARMKLVAEALELKKYDVSAGDQIFSMAANYITRTEYYDENGDTVGWTEVKVPWLMNKMPFLLRHLPNAFKIFASTRVKRSTISDTQIKSIRTVRCYFLAEDDDREIENWWRVGDLARCQTLNVVSAKRDDFTGITRKAGNIFWWRKVKGVSANTGQVEYRYINSSGNIITQSEYDNLTAEEKEAYWIKRDYNGTKIEEDATQYTGPVTLDDGKKYHWIDVEYDWVKEHSGRSEAPSEWSGAALLSDIPCAGDTAVQFGNISDPNRMNLMTLELNGLMNADAPCMKIYRGIYCFDMSKCWWGGMPRKMKLSPSTGYEFYGPSFRFIQEYGIARVPVDRGDWNSITKERDDYRAHEQVTKCYYYNRVTHNGSLWLCVASYLETGEGTHWIWDGTSSITVDGTTYAKGDYLPNSAYNILSESNKARCTRKQDYVISEPSDNSADWEKQVAKGADGENTVQLILDNQHEDFLYSDTGLVSPSGGATSPVHLYDGETDKTPQATFRVFDDYTQTWVTSTGSSASAAASVTANNGVVTLSVTALRSDSAKVRVRAEYPASSGKYFYAEFTANKVKQDKYDLIVKPSSITYNSASYSAVMINASAKRTDLQGNQTTPSISTTANSGNLRLFKGFVNSAGTIQSLTRQTAASYRVTAQNCIDYIGIYFELRWYINSSTADNSSDTSTYRLCDYETVEIAKAENGTNGNDAHEVNPNILLRTIFDQGIDSVKEKWFPRLSWDNIFVDTANDTIVLGRKSIRIVAPLDDYEDLTQHVYEYNVHQGVKTNTWYTLSFYSFSGKQQASTSEEEHFLHTYVYPESDSACIDISQVYVDGVQKTLTSNNGRVEWANAWTGARHTFTFKTLSSFPTNYVDVKFRALAGGIVCICMPKLEEGKTATAYLPNEDDTIGADGESGVNVVATPSAIIVNQDVTNTDNLSNLSGDTAARCVFSIMKGTQQLTVTAVNVSSTSHCAAQDGSRNYVQLTSITSNSGKYYDSGYVICSLTYNDGGTNRTITNVRVNFYANLLGTWAVETTAAATTAAGEKIETELGPNGAITTKYTAAIQANAKELRSEYTEQISRAGDYNRNLFGYNRGITLGCSSGELPIPFIQGYGLLLRGLQDGVTGGRLYNLKLDGVGGPFVITCQMRLSASSSGKKVLMELCGKVNTRGEGSVPADSDYVGISATWTNYEFHLDITDEQAVHADLDGYLDIQGNWSGAPYIYIRHLKIERGMKATDWCEADEDIAYLGHGQMITALTANSKDNQGTTMSGTNITKTTFTINDSQKAGYAISVNLSNLASGRYINFLEQRDAFTLTAGKVYTLSYWANGTAGIVLKNYLYRSQSPIITGIGSNVYDPGNNGTIVEGVTADGETSIRLNNEWLYYCVHFYVANSVTGANVIPLRLLESDNRSLSGSLSIKIADIQLQEGYVVSETYFRSMIEQNARRISLVQQTGSRLAGIDIENGIVNLKGDRVIFSNGVGNVSGKIAINPETGTLYAVDGEFSGTVTVDRLISNSKSVDSSIYNNWPADSSYQNTKKMPLSATGFITTFNIYGSGTYQISLIGLEGEAETGQEFTFLSRGTATIKLYSSGELKAYQQGVIYSGNNITLKQGFPVRFLWTGNEWCIIWGYFES